MKLGIFKSKLKYVVICLIVIIGVIQFVSGIHPSRNIIRTLLIQKIDELIPEEGDCVLDLSELFSGFLWDSFTIFEPPYQRDMYDKLQIKNEDGQSGIAFHFEDKLQLIDYSSYEFVHHRSSKEITYCIYYSKQSSQNNYITLLKDKSHVKAKKEKNAHSGGKWLYVIYLYE